MFWVQETANRHNNSTYRNFYAEYTDDIDLLPTDKECGKQDNGDSVANHPCALGSECICIESAELYILTRSGWTIPGG